MYDIINGKSISLSTNEEASQKEKRAEIASNAMSGFCFDFGSFTRQNVILLFQQY